jgi:hypothetical protein
MLTLNNEEVMQWSDVQDMLNRMTPEQLAKPAAVFDGDNGGAIAIREVGLYLDFGGFDDERDEPFRQQMVIGLAGVGITEDE